MYNLSDSCMCYTRYGGLKRLEYSARATFPAHRSSEQNRTSPTIILPIGHIICMISYI